MIVRNYQTRPVVPAHPLAAMAEVVRRRVDVPDGIFGVAFVNDALMIEHHGRFLGKAEPTDVLSFPNELFGLAVDSAADAEAAEPDRYWGDVIICTDAAARQARDLSHPYPYEVSVLVIHGVLHLLGYDHTRDGGTMTRLEQALRPLCWLAGRPA